MKKLFAAALVLATPVAAHHGFRMEYDASKAYWIEGEIVSGYYGLPHAEFDLRITPGAMPEEGFADEKVADLVGKLRPAPRDLRPVVEIEFPQQERFWALGDTLKTGDRVAVIVLRGCEEPKPLRAQWVRLPDGSSVRAGGTVQAETMTCEPESAGRD
jgi:hypothetical protein